LRYLDLVSDDVIINSLLFFAFESNFGMA